MFFSCSSVACPTPIITHTQAVAEFIGGLRSRKLWRSRATSRKHAVCTYHEGFTQGLQKGPRKKREQEVRTQVARDEGVEVPGHGVAVQVDVRDVLGPQAAPQLRPRVEVVPAARGVETGGERIG